MVSRDSISFFQPHSQCTKYWQDVLQRIEGLTLPEQYSIASQGYQIASSKNYDADSMLNEFRACYALLVSNDLSPVHLFDVYSWVRTTLRQQGFLVSEVDLFWIDSSTQAMDVANRAYAIANYQPCEQFLPSDEP